MVSLRFDKYKEFLFVTCASRWSRTTEWRRRQGGWAQPQLRREHGSIRGRGLNKARDKKELCERHPCTLLCGRLHVLRRSCVGCVVCVCIECGGRGGLVISGGAIPRMPRGMALT